MNALQKIKKLLTKYPHIQYEETDYSISINPTNERGFIVGLDISEIDTFIVFFDGSHFIFYSEESALNFLYFGLSRNCRLKILVLLKMHPQRWEVQRKEGMVWKKYMEFEYGMSAFEGMIRRYLIEPLLYRTVYKQNNIIT